MYVSGFLEPPGKEEGRGGTRAAAVDGGGAGSSAFAMMGRLDSGYAEGIDMGDSSSDEEALLVQEESSGAVLREKDGAVSEDELAEMIRERFFPSSSAPVYSESSSLFEE